MLIICNNHVASSTIADARLLKALLVLVMYLRPRAKLFRQARSSSSICHLRPNITSEDASILSSTTSSTTNRRSLLLRIKPEKGLFKQDHFIVDTAYYYVLQTPH
jgi:hypothetical protein